MRSIVLAAVVALATATPALALSDAAVTRSGGTLTVSWAATGPVDVYASPQADATVKTASLVSRADADGRYEQADNGTERRYFLLRDTRTGKTARVAERLLPLATGSNFRDLGGYPTASGKHVRWGKIFRSGATPKLDAADVARVQSLGLSSMIDLRSSEERLMAPTKLTGIRYSAIDYSLLSMMPKNATAMRNGGAVYRGMPAFLVPQLKMVFDDLLGRKGPVMYHCTAGQDRTGITTALILHALGVPRATILEDYHLTTQVRQPANEMVPITPAMTENNPVAKMFASYQKDGKAAAPEPLRDPDGRAFLDSAFDEVEKRYGSVDAFLEKEVGLTKGNLALLRATYLE
jgi:protein-tyrosine phosphatase